MNTSSYIRIIAILLLTIPRPVAAETSITRTKELKQICTTEEATGLLWKGGKWKATLFTLDKFVVEKVEPPKTYREAQKIGGEALTQFIECQPDLWP